MTPRRQRWSLALVLTSFTAPTLAQCDLVRLPLWSAADSDIGTALDVDGDRAVIGGASAGVAIVAVRRAAGWREEAVLSANDPSALGFGTSVAIDGDRLAVAGGGGELSPLSIVTTFERSHDVWVFDEEIVGPGYATAVALQDDELFVTSAAGTLDVFRRDPGGWVLADSVPAPGATQDDSFGSALAVQDDQVFVSDPTHAVHGVQLAGRVTVFRRVDGRWSMHQILTAPGAPASARFGKSLDLDGDLAVVGAYSENAFQGAAYVFARQDSEWEFEQRLADDLTPVPGDRFGESVAVSGEQVLVGGGGVESAPLSHVSGNAWLYDRDGGAWSLAREYNTPITWWLSHGRLGTAVDFWNGRALMSAPRVQNFLFWQLAKGGVFEDPDPADLNVFVRTNAATVPFGVHWQDIDVTTCAAQPGAPYLVLGSLTGFTPGFELAGHVVPVVFDAYTLFTVTNANLGPLENTFGLLDVDGTATPRIVLPRAGLPALVGVTLTHATLVFDPLFAPTGVSEPFELYINA